MRFAYFAIQSLEKEQLGFGGGGGAISFLVHCSSFFTRYLMSRSLCMLSIISIDRSVNVPKLQDMALKFPFSKGSTICSHVDCGGIHVSDKISFTFFG